MLRRTLRTLVVLAMLAGLALVGAGTASAHNTSAPATPGNIDQGYHGWPTDRCSVPNGVLIPLPGSERFTHACIHHDGCYQGLNRAGKEARISRLSCDLTFLIDMRASCAGNRQCEQTAAIFFTAVRAFGGQYYKGTGSRF